MSVAGEAVRLVIWDLDETFWRGTLVEGGISEYLWDNHQIVIELANRGIISSICSKNDRETVLRILRDKNIADYFVMPSVSWDPKGSRLAALVDAFQLRPSTVMFIDDNPGYRGEAATMVPGMQIEDEHFPKRLLADPRFKGKDDTGLSRLKQYRLLEKRNIDLDNATGGNEEFLRGCDIRLLVDYDIDANIDRAVELVNRTNQLNFTKKRFSENIEAAQNELRGFLGRFNYQAGLIRVADKYGDYGYVGFFMTNSLPLNPGASRRNIELIHFCFSCRTLGMLVEQWVYDWLGRPQLQVVGEVLTDLEAPRNIDWVRQVTSLTEAGKVADISQIAPEVVLFGGCEAQAIGVFIGQHTRKLTVIGGYTTNGLMVRVQSTEILLQARPDQEIFKEEALTLGLSIDHHVYDWLDSAPEGTLYVLNFAVDYCPDRCIIHKQHKWLLSLDTQIGLGGGQILGKGALDFEAHLDAHSNFYTPELRKSLLHIHEHVHTNYDFVDKQNIDQAMTGVEQVIARIPDGTKCIFIVHHPMLRTAEANLLDMHEWRSYAEALNEVTKRYSYVGIVSYSEAISDDSEIIQGNHYNRAVYMRCAKRVADLSQTLELKRVHTGGAGKSFWQRVFRKTLYPVG